MVSLEVGETDTMRFFYGGAMSVSPDGRWMVFPAVGEDGASRYWLRSLETVEARPLAGTETAYVPAGWSADSRYVIFSLIGGRRLSKVDIQGGPPQTLSDEFNFTLNGLTSTKDVLLFGTAGSTPLFRLPASGGKPVPVTAVAKGDATHRFPQFLPDGKHFLYLRLAADPAASGIYVGSIDAKPEEQDTRRLMPANRQAYYSAAAGGPGYLVFMRDTTLLAQPFDPVKLEFSGEPIPIAESVDSFTPVSYGLFSVSDTGVLVYRKGAGSGLRLTWLDANGNTVGTPGDPNLYVTPAASPDGTRIAAALGPGGAPRDIWIIDEKRNVPTLFTFDTGNEDNPVWSPDSRYIVFSSNREGQPHLYIKPADGSGEERRVTEQVGIPTSWSKDGRYVLFTTPLSNPKTGGDIWAVPDPRIASGNSKPFPVLATEFNEGAGQFSPDGRWIAYTSNETNPVDVYVRPFSPDGSSTTSAKWLVSKGFGTAPRWRSDGKQLFYITANTFGVMAVDVDTTKGFQALTTRRLFTAPPPLVPTGWNLGPDDKRFLFISSPSGGRTAPFTVVLNWAATLKK
jgi:Tol biopolymer transport system component